MHLDEYEAFFDCFFITDNLEKATNGVLAGEINLYAYLACLLGVFGGLPASSWGYSFASTEYGTPSSGALIEAINSLEKRGDIQKVKGAFITTAQGRATWKAFEDHFQFSQRTPYLKAATDCVLALPTSTVRYALYNEPSVKSANLKHKASNLLGDITIDLLHEQFRALREVLGTTDDLFLPATVWMSYLSKEKDRAAA